MSGWEAFGYGVLGAIAVVVALFIIACALFPGRSGG